MLKVLDQGAEATKRANRELNLLQYGMPEEHLSVEEADREAELVCHNVPCNQAHSCNMCISPPAVVAGNAAGENNQLSEPSFGPMLSMHARF